MVDYDNYKPQTTYLTQHNYGKGGRMLLNNNSCNWSCVLNVISVASAFCNYVECQWPLTK